ncbi:MAG: GIY-YIG nuclease family protein [Candidatus Omnitrophota bacterium]
MSQWVLYILKCSDSSLYTGITTDLDKRLSRHNQGRACKYTRSRKPVRLVYNEIFDNESSARKREIEIKKLSRLNKLRLIKHFLSSRPPSKAWRGGLGMKFSDRKI